MPKLTPEELKKIMQDVDESQPKVLAPAGEKPLPMQPVDMPAPRLSTVMYDPMDKRLGGPAREAVDRSKQEVLGDPRLHPVENQFVTNLGAGLAANNVPEGYLSEPESTWQEIGAGAGHGLGLLTDMLLAKRLGVPSPVAFGAYGALQPAETGKDRLKNAGKFVLLDRLLHLMPRVLIGGAGKAVSKAVSPEAGKAVVNRGVEALKNPLGRLGYNQAVFSGLSELEPGGSAKEDFWRNLGASAVFSVPTGMGSPEPPREVAGAPRVKNTGPKGVAREIARELRQSNLTSEEITKGRELASEINRAKEVPVPGDKMSEVLTPFTAKQEALTDMIARATEKPIEGEYTPERVAEIAKDLAAKKKAGQFKGDVEKKAERMALEETLPEDWVDAVREAEAYRDRVADAEFFGLSTKKIPKPRLNLNQSEARAEFKHPMRILQAMGGGEIGYKNVVDKYLLRPPEQAIEAKMLIGDYFEMQFRDIAERNLIKEGDPVDMTVGRIRELVGDKSLHEVSGTKEFKDILGKLETVDQYERAMSAAKDVAELSEQWRGLQNEIYDSLGQEGIAYREGWFPKNEKSIHPLNIPAKIKRSWKGGTPESDMGQIVPEVRPTDKFFDKHKLRRTGRAMENRDWSFVRNFDRYRNEAAEGIVYPLAMAHQHAFAKHLQMAGFKPSANIINWYTQSDLNGRDWGATGAFDNAVFKGGGVPGLVGDFFMWNYSRLADSVFTLNVAWNAFTQPLSRALTVGNAGARNTQEAALLAMVPELRDAIAEKSHTSIIKGRKDGSVSHLGQEESSRPVGKMSKRGAYRTVLDKGQLLNRVVERDLDIEAGVAGALDAKARGLMGREVLDRASDVSAKSQSRYDRLYRPQALRSRTAKILVPFVGWKFESIANVLEGAGLGAGNYKQNAGVQGKANYITRASAAMMLAAIWAGVAGRDAYGPSSIPAFDIITGDGITGGKLFPATVYQDGLKIYNSAADGEYGDAIKRLSRSKVPTSKMLSNAGDAAAYNSGQGDFYLPDDQVLLAIIIGVRNTPAAKAHRDAKKQGKQSTVRRR